MKVPAAPARTWLLVVVSEAFLMSCIHMLTADFPALTLAEARRKLMESEEEERRKGKSSYGSADGPTAFVLLGMEIEEMQ